MADEARSQIEAKRVECVNRSMLHGIATGPVVFALVYFTQKRAFR